MICKFDFDLIIFYDGLGVSTQIYICVVFLEMIFIHQLSKYILCFVNERLAETYVNVIVSVKNDRNLSLTM